MRPGTGKRAWKVGWGRFGKPDDFTENGVGPCRVRTRDMAFARAGILAHLAGCTVTVTNLVTGKRYRVDVKGDVR